jgi:uncharacterized membrane protein HdeD (DUF308 family)
MTTTTAPAQTLGGNLRRLYFVRFGFALVWAALMFTTAKEIGALSATLLVIYPLFDVAAAIVDVRSSRKTGLYVNIAISSLATVGLAVAAASGIPAALRVWGAWAVVAGAIQLVVGLSRRRMGGQWPMILSGGISVLAGGSFIAGASKDGASLSGLAGYALLGGIFFLVSALRLGRGSKA